jgi:Tfp pilus assembly protein PilN
MIQFNLLPDIKIQYLKAKRQEHAVVLGAVVATIAAITVLIVLLAVVHGLQKKSINDLSADIKASSKQLQETPNLTKILTVQSQLTSLPALHDKKAASSRLFEFMSQLTPEKATISEFEVDTALNTLAIKGATEDLTVVNRYVDTLKFTTYALGERDTKKNAFSKVVLASFTRSDKAATYGITLAFDPAILSNKEEASLTVPQIISTRSEVDKPSALFQSTGQ